MKKSISYIIWGMLLLMIFFRSEVVHATSWAELEPEEVHKRADVIVVGQYDFTSRANGRNMLFTSYEFIVKKVYRGDVSHKIRVGIDGNDVGWADEYQKDGGDFLLFLDKNKEFSYLTPVGGPNGMIQITNGGLKHYNSTSRAYYEEFLKKQKEEPIMKRSNESDHNSNNKYLYISFIVILLGIVISILFQRLKNINKI